MLNRANVAAGEKLDIGVSYTKTDTGLSAPQLAVTATGVPQQAAVASSTDGAADWLPWVLIGLGVLLFGGILVYWLLSRRSPEPAPVASTPRTGRSAGSTPTRRAPPPQKPLPTVPARAPDAPAPAAGPVAYCVNCGHALKGEDRFCSQCGTPRRS